MRVLKKITITLTMAVLSVAVLATFAVIYTNMQLPESFTVVGEELEIAHMPYLTATKSVGETVEAASGETSSYNAQLNLFGILPVKTVRVMSIERQTLTALGTPFGVKMFADGVMVVGFSDIPTSTGYKNPGKLAGLKLGDVIVSIGDEKMVANSDVGEAIAGSDGVPIEVIYKRDGEQKSCIITAVRDEIGGEYRSGVWVRDSSAGIGTLTFADNENMIFGGLGHPVSDTDTGQAIELLSGEIVPVTISGATAGRPGTAGELRGEFAGDITLGEVLRNDNTGVYGELFSHLEGDDYEVATPSETVTGTATILATVDSEGAKPYRIDIERVFHANDDFTKNMVVRITDQELLEKTGGIVQGMSGSPILQNGRLIGAVTHVFVNDPTRGYGIFIENMLESAENIAE